MPAHRTRQPKRADTQGEPAVPRASPASTDVPPMADAEPAGAGQCIAFAPTVTPGTFHDPPVLLEPMMAVEVTTPEDYMGEVIGDINSRRGQIQAMEERAGARVVKGLVPLSEMFGYIGDLRSKTQGRAVYSMTFSSYAEVPKAVAEEIIQKVRGGE